MSKAVRYIVAWVCFSVALYSIFLSADANPPLWAVIGAGGWIAIGAFLAPSVKELDRD